MFHCFAHPGATRRIAGVNRVGVGALPKHDSHWDQSVRKASLEWAAL
jgi:hypothetical protein